MDQLGAAGAVVEVGAVPWMWHKAIDSLLAVDDILSRLHTIAGH